MRAARSRQPTESGLQKPGRRNYEKGKKMEADLSNPPPKSSKTRTY